MARGTTGLLSFSDIYVLDNIVSHTGIMAGRNLIIDVLRECFQRDREYSWKSDPWGFNKTPSHVGLDIDAGVVDDTTTRIYIGASYRYDITYLPALIVRQTGSSYKPLSFNQNKWVLEYDTQQIIDGYGNITYMELPARYVYAGLWDQTFEVKIMSKSLEDTTALADIVSITLQHTYREILQQNGLFIKSIRTSGEQTESIGANDPLFTISITVDTLSEWRREVPVSDLIDRIQFCFDFDIVDSDPPTTDHFKYTIE